MEFYMNSTNVAASFNLRDLSKEIVDLIHRTDFPFTDLIIEEDASVMAKTPYGLIEVPNFPICDREDLKPVLELMSETWEADLEQRGDISMAREFQDWRLRITAYTIRQNTKIKLAIRRVLRQPLTLIDIGLHQLPVVLNDGGGKGLILVCGPQASGKSTTMAACLHHINMTRQAHIVTIEDPIEYQHRKIKSIFSEREIGPDVKSYAEGVRVAMRMLCNVIAIGEIRDRETADETLRAAESGLLVIATLHANSAEGAIQKMLNFYRADERAGPISVMRDKLMAVINQLLIPAANRQTWVLAPETLFNHKGQIQNLIDNPSAIRNLMTDDANGKKFSKNMVTALKELVQTEKVTKVDALNALAGMQKQQLIDALVEIKGIDAAPQPEWQ